jgi:NAD(P)-dependent dehydrogenase (short-subunit alcohol dehydrogenase family)
MSVNMRPDTMRGKVALVTGGGSGIGRASSIAFAAVGARVVVSDVAADGAEQTVAMIREAGGEASFVRADVSRSAAGAALVRATVERDGRLDYAHNNAGILGPLGSLLDYSEDTWDALMAVNLKGVWLCMKHQIPRCLRRAAGRLSIRPQSPGCAAASGSSPTARASGA